MYHGAPPSADNGLGRMETYQNMDPRVTFLSMFPVSDVLSVMSGGRRRSLTSTSLVVSTAGFVKRSASRDDHRQVLLASRP